MTTGDTSFFERSKCASLTRRADALYFEKGSYIDTEPETDTQTDGQTD